jgi:hypothetical protein
MQTIVYSHMRFGEPDAQSSGGWVTLGHCKKPWLGAPTSVGVEMQGSEFSGRGFKPF